jgi:hypothetical protein
VPQKSTADSSAPDQYAALRVKCAELLQRIGYAPEEKLYQWLMERLSLLDTRSIGFAHHLVDKLRHWHPAGRESRVES